MFNNASNLDQVLTKWPTVSSSESSLLRCNMSVCRSRARAAEAGGPTMMLPVGFEQPSLDVGKHAISHYQITPV